MRADAAFRDELQVIGRDGTHLDRKLSSTAGGQLVGVEFGPETLRARGPKDLPGFGHGVR